MHVLEMMRRGINRKPIPGSGTPPTDNKTAAIRLPCLHEGRVVHRCPKGDPSRDVLWCELHKAGVKRVSVCRTCDDHVAKSNVPHHAAIVPATTQSPLALTPLARFDETNLWPGQVPHRRFNASLAAMPDGGGYLFACRNGWSGSDVFTGRLDAQFRIVTPPSRLNLRHSLANVGREDPRLFWHRDQIHVAFIGVGRRRMVQTHQMFARLTPDGTGVEDVFAPDLKPRRSWEKNWSLFDYEGRLYAVYLTHPRHVVVRIDCNTATLVHDTPFPGVWDGGEVRGGAPPVRVGDEFYSFFHDRIVANGRRRYRTGLYTFDAAPPFAPRRWVPTPIISADQPEFADGVGINYCDAVFTCGAVLAGSRWLLSHGVHDLRSEIHALDAAALESRLVPAG